MIVDDEEFCISMLKHLIGIFDIDTQNHIDFCINGKEAIKTVEQAQALGIKYSLILMDFSMP